jgi:hypothetical protein
MADGDSEDNTPLKKLKTKAVPAVCVRPRREGLRARLCDSRKVVEEHTDEEGEDEEEGGSAHDKQDEQDEEDEGDKEFIPDSSARIRPAGSSSVASAQEAIALACPRDIICEAGGARGGSRSGGGDEESAYELKRKQNIKKNNELMEKLGISNTLQELQAGAPHKGWTAAAAAKEAAAAAKVSKAARGPATVPNKTERGALLFFRASVYIYIYIHTYIHTYM